MMSLGSIKFLDTSFIDATLKDLFIEIFPEILNDLTTYFKENEFPGSSDWLRDAILYNVPNGKLSRGLSVVTAFRYCGTNVNHINLRKCCILGWCIEILQASFLIIDDLMSIRPFRRGQPSWYTVNNQGILAIKDALVLENSVYYLIRKYFRYDSYYAEILTAFHDVTLKTSMGGDLFRRAKTAKELSELTLDRYRAIVKNKISFQSFYLPIYLVFLMSGVTDEMYLSHVELICQKIGYTCQIQEDILDCFGPEKEEAEKDPSSSFIAEGHCTWPILKALELANDEQKQILFENYGQVNEVADDKDEEAIIKMRVDKVKQVYKELNILDEFYNEEEGTIVEINSLICQLGNPKHVSFFTSFVNSYYKRLMMKTAR